MYKIYYVAGANINWHLEMLSAQNKINVSFSFQLHSDTEINFFKIENSVPRLFLINLS